MVYYDDGEILIRAMERADAEAILAAELAQGYHETMGKYETRLGDQAAGRSAALVALYKGDVAGYVNVYFDAPRGAFAGTGWCEIVDFGVLEKYRRRGVGTRLMDAAESLAFLRADTVYLGVGLHSGYGSAQRMYVRRGYVPDGTGVWYGDKILEPYGPCCNDDDLVLYLSKKAGG